MRSIEGRRRLAGSRTGLAVSANYDAGAGPDMRNDVLPEFTTRTIAAYLPHELQVGFRWLSDDSV